MTSANGEQLPEDAVAAWVREQLAHCPPLSVAQRRLIRAQLAEPDRAAPIGRAS